MLVKQGANLAVTWSTLQNSTRLRSFKKLEHSRYNYVNRSATSNFADWCLDLLSGTVDSVKYTMSIKSVSGVLTLVILNPRYPSWNTRQQNGSTLSVAPVCMVVHLWSFSLPQNSPFLWRLLISAIQTVFLYGSLIKLWLLPSSFDHSPRILIVASSYVHDESFLGAPL